MKLTLERAPLLAALARADKVVERRNTIPILANLRLRANPGGLHVTATDLDIEIGQDIPAEVAAGGGTTAPAHTLFEIVRKLPDGAQIHVETAGDGGTLTVKAGRSRFTLQTLAETEYPEPARMTDGIEIALPGATLAAALARVEFAISTEETRYYLNGIHMRRVEAEGEPRLALVATDGHRLSLVTLSAPVPDSLPGVIIPRKAVDQLKRLAELADKADLRMEVSTSRLAAQAAGVRITTKLIDGTFPDYERVIPRANPRIATLHAEHLAAAVDRVGTIASDRSRAVKFTWRDGELAVSATNPEAGEATDTVDCRFDGEELQTGFNARYVADVLGSFGGKGEIQFALADPGSPTLVRHPDDPHALCVLMPMRV